MSDPDAQAGSFPSLKQRLVALLAYTFGLYFFGGVVTGLWLPTGGPEWSWWSSAIALYLVTTLQAPFFHRPRDVLANSGFSALMLFTIDLASVQSLRVELTAFRWASLAFVVGTGSGFALPNKGARIDSRSCDGARTHSLTVAAR